jgi:hypothetical protein
MCVPTRTAGTIPNNAHNEARYPSPAAALAIKSSPTPTTTIPMARATRSPFGASRSAVIAAVTRAITRTSMIPMTNAVEAEAQPVSPSRGSIRGKRTLASRWLPAAGKVIGLPPAELKSAGDHDDNTDRDRNNSRQRRPLHFDLGKRRAQRENNNSEHSPDEEVPDAD